jgi:hypothetical protein
LIAFIARRDALELAFYGEKQVVGIFTYFYVFLYTYFYSSSLAVHKVQQIYLRVKA